MELPNADVTIDVLIAHFQDLLIPESNQNLQFKINVIIRDDSHSPYKSKSKQQQTKKIALSIYSSSFHFKNEK